MSSPQYQFVIIWNKNKQMASFFLVLNPQTFTGFSGDDDNNSSDAGLTKEERKEKYRCQRKMIVPKKDDRVKT